MQRLVVGKMFLFAMLLTCAKSAFADLFTFTNIDVPGATATEAYGINNLGQIVGLYTDASGVQHGFLDSGGALTTRAEPALAINDHGEIVGDVLSAPGYSELFPYGINDNGQIVGFEGDGFGFIYTGGTVTIPLPYFRSYIFGINDSGQIVGWYNAHGSGGGLFGFVATGPPYGCPSPTCNNMLSLYPYGISDAGLIVGTSISRPFDGLVYAGGNYTPVNDPNAGTGPSQGTIPRGINNNDEIVGYYIDANGVTHGFLATPTAAVVPEPRTLPLLFACLTVFAVVVRQNSKRLRQE